MARVEVGSTTATGSRRKRKMRKKKREREKKRRERERERWGKKADEIAARPFFESFLNYVSAPD